MRGLLLAVIGIFAPRLGAREPDKIDFDGRKVSILKMFGHLKTMIDRLTTEVTATFDAHRRISGDFDQLQKAWQAVAKVPFAPVRIALSNRHLR